jgi:hypothetical protein
LEKNNERTGTDLRRSDEMAILKNRQKERIKSSSEHEHQKIGVKRHYKIYDWGRTLYFWSWLGPRSPGTLHGAGHIETNSFSTPLIDPTNKLGQET